MQFRTTLVAALAAATSLASNAQWWNSADPTPLKYRGTAMEIKPVYDRRMRDLAAMEANAALVDGKFDIVDRMYDDFAANGGLRRTDGGWMLESIHTMFAQRCDTMDDRAARKELDKWAAARPGSKLRPVVEVMTLQCQAWKARGGGYANEVAGEAMQIFHEKLRKAAKALEETEAVGKESPLWWWAALGIAGSSGMPPEQFDALFAEAARRFPSYQPLYQTRVNFLLPQWGGDFAEVERFATESLAFSHDKEGDAMYAWIYVDLGRKVPDLFGSSASWPRMKKAFEDLNQRYPDAWNKNLFATFACRARDKETTGRLLLELGDKAQLGAYSSGVTTESCRRFAVMAS